MRKPEIPPISTNNIDIEAIIEIYKDNDLVSRITEIEKNYPYWDTFKYKARGLKFDPVKLWNFVKFNRQKSVALLKIADIKGFNFKYNTTSVNLKLLHEFDLNLGGVLEGGAIIPTEDKKKYLISSIMEEAIASSQLEGAATTREVAKEMLRMKRAPTNYSEQMILNNYLTINKLLEFKNEKLTKELILEMHSIISKGTLDNPENEGSFRKNNDVKVVDGISGEIFYDPPEFNNIEHLIEALCDFANNTNDKEFIHPIVRAIILHFLIGYIHPFVDGNGRTARAVFYWFLISKGYWLVEYLSISRIIIKSSSQYAKAYLYTEYDDNDLTYFVQYNLKSVDLALKSLKEYIKRKLDEKKNLFQLIKHENVNNRQAEILRWLITDNQRVITINEIEVKFDVVYQTARTDLLGLVELGYLKSKQVQRKLIFFCAEDFDKKIHQLHS